MITGETIRLLRNWKKLKQQTVAHRLGISQPAYSKIERNNSITRENLKRVLIALDTTQKEMKVVEKLIHGENSKNKGKVIKYNQ